MIKLSVNINKLALIRNSRGGNNPNLVKSAKDCELFGADGITIHPRPDERHVKYSDVYELNEVIKTEFNIEGNPKEQKFIDLVLAINPVQVTLVPDNQNQLTSDHGWDTVQEFAYLSEIITVFKKAGIRTSVFVDPNLKMVEGAAKVGADRIELYTESYAANYDANKEAAILPYIQSAQTAINFGLGINAGHDLNKENLAYFAKNITGLMEVSIGHALVCDAIYLGLENTIQIYKRALMN
jgi:pyridoxine 5-phosphate synthase